MDRITPIGKMIETLKDEFRTKGIHYHDVAVRLQVSEGTVKRYLRGKAVTLSALQKMAEIVDLDLLSLPSLAQRNDKVERTLNKTQEEALIRNRLPRGVMYFLARGWTPAQIGLEFEITDRMEGLLAKLKTLGLIRKVSVNSFRILARPAADYRHAGMLTERTLKRTRQFLATINLRDTRCLWLYHHARLSAGSAVRLQEIIKRFEADLQALGAQGDRSSPHPAQWYQVFLGAEPMSTPRVLE